MTTGVALGLPPNKKRPAPASPVVEPANGRGDLPWRHIRLSVGGDWRLGKSLSVQRVGYTKTKTKTTPLALRHLRNPRSLTEP
jgi:hypothetical protein